MSDASAPILERLATLERAVADFVSAERARMLCFQLADDEKRLFAGFVEVDRGAAHEEYVLLTLDEPFAERSTHGFSLVQALLAAERERTEALAEDDVYDVPWTAPPAPQRVERRRGEPPPDQVYLVRALESLKELHCAPGQRLLLCLVPEAVTDTALYARWLADLGFLLADSDVRVCVTSELERDFGRALARAHPERVQLVRADLNMPAALLEISAAADDAEDPSGHYRRAFLQAHNALRAADANALQRFCQQAAQIAEQESWSHLEFAAHQLFASGALGFGDLRGAFKSFEDAERATHHDIRFGATWMSPLLLQARMGKGSVAVVGQVWRLGARIFGLEALPVARAIGDPRTELECRRMAAYCEEREGNVAAAREHALAALAIGEALPQAERRQTTLPYVAEALLRMTRGLSQRSERARLKERLRELLGDDWERLLEPRSASPEEAEASAEALGRSGAVTPSVGPSGTRVLGDEVDDAEEAAVVPRTLTAAVDPAAALQALVSAGPALDAAALTQLVSQTWSEREPPPREWSEAGPEPVDVNAERDEPQR